MKNNFSLKILIIRVEPEDSYYWCIACLNTTLCRVKNKKNIFSIYLREVFLNFHLKLEYILRGINGSYYLDTNIDLRKDEYIHVKQWIVWISFFFSFLYIFNAFFWNHFCDSWKQIFVEAHSNTANSHIFEVTLWGIFFSNIFSYSKQLSD